MALFKRRRADDSHGDFEDEVEVALRVLEQYPLGTAVSFGAPVRCPICANFGLVEEVDVAGGSWHNRCVTCGHEWVLTARGVRAAGQRVAERALASGEELYGIVRIGDRGPASTTAGVRFTRDPLGEVTRHDLEPAPAPAAASWAVASAEPDEPAPAPAPAVKAPLRVLLIEDDPSDLEVVRAILEPAGPSVIDLRWAPTRAAGEAAARSEEPDLVLLDLGLPDSHGLQTVTQWHFNHIDAPVLVVSGEYGPEVVDRGRELGVSGFMAKSELADLLAAGDDGTTAFLDRLETALSGV